MRISAPRLGYLFGLLLALTTPQTSVAQHLETSLSPGLRVRVLAPSHAERRLVGRVQALSPDSLALVHGDSLARVPWLAIEELEVSRGKRRILGALYGAGAGALIGGTALAAVAALSHDPQDAEWSRGAGAALGFAVGAFTGLWSGAAVGGFVGRERWQPTPIPQQDRRPGHAVLLVVSVQPPRA